MTQGKSAARPARRARRATPQPAKASKKSLRGGDLAAPGLIYLYLCVAAVVTLFAHRTPGYGVETDLLTDFAPAARSLLKGVLDVPLYQFHGFGYPLLLALFSLPTGGDFFLAGKILNLLSACTSLWLAALLYGPPLTGSGCFARRGALLRELLSPFRSRQ